MHGIVRSSYLNAVSFFENPRVVFNVLILLPRIPQLQIVERHEMDAFRAFDGTSEPLNILCMSSEFIKLLCIQRFPEQIYERDILPIGELPP